MRSESEANEASVRGGYAYVRQSMHSTRNTHAVHVEGTRRMYLCQCNRGAIWSLNPSRLARNRRKDHRWGDNFRYRKIGAPVDRNTNSTKEK